MWSKVEENDTHRHNGCVHSMFICKQDANKRVNSSIEMMCILGKLFDSNNKYVYALFTRTIINFQRASARLWWIRKRRDNIRNINHKCNYRLPLFVSKKLVQDIWLQANDDAHAKCINYELLEANLFGIISNQKEKKTQSGKQTINLVVLIRRQCWLFIFTWLPESVSNAHLTDVLGKRVCAQCIENDFM